jgi:hypothetical protein
MPVLVVNYSCGRYNKPGDSMGDFACTFLSAPGEVSTPIMSLESYLSIWGKHSMCRADPCQTLAAKAAALESAGIDYSVAGGHTCRDVVAAAVQASPCSHGYLP